MDMKKSKLKEYYGVWTILCICLLCFAPKDASAKHPTFVISHIKNAYVYKNSRVDVNPIRTLRMWESYYVSEEEDGFYKLKSINRVGKRGESIGDDIGWVKKGVLMEWSIPHALVPKKGPTPLYCKKEEIQKLVNGLYARKCASITIANNKRFLQLTEKSNIPLKPFPVLDAFREKGLEGSMRNFIYAALPVSTGKVIFRPERRGVEKRMLSRIDLVVVLDNTQSMSDEAAAIHDVLSAFIMDIDQQKDLDIHVNLITYTDKNVRMTGLKPVNEVINRIPKQGNGTDEWLLDALWLSTQTEWRPGTRPWLIVMGDEPSNLGEYDKIPLTQGVGAHPDGGRTPKRKSFNDLYNEMELRFKGRVHFRGIVTMNENKATTALMEQFNKMIQTSSKRQLGLFATHDAVVMEPIQSTRMIIDDFQEVFHKIKKDLNIRVADTTVDFSGSSTSRYHELLREAYGSDVALKKVYIEENSSAFDDVILLERDQIRTITGILSKAQNIIGRKNQATASNLWEDIWGSLFGMQTIRVKDSINQSFWSYLGRHAPANSILNKSPRELSYLSGIDKRNLLNEIERRRNWLNRELSNNEDAVYHWIPFNKLP